MKRVIILGSKNFGEKNNPHALAAACRERLGEKVIVSQYNFENLLFEIIDSRRRITHGHEGVDIADTDLVIALNWYSGGVKSLRDIAFTVSLYLEERNVPFWNSEISQQRSTTKLSAMYQLSQLGVDIPATYFSLNKDLLSALSYDGSVVVKDIAGSRGRNNYVAASKEELTEILHENANSRFMVQPLIGNDFDVRIICFNARPYVVIKRQRKDDTTHLNNTSQGGRSELVPLSELPMNLLQEVEKICEHFRREMAGIDYLVANDGSNRYICLEVNAIPQLTSGSFQQEKMDAFAKALINKEKS